MLFILGFEAETVGFDAPEGGRASAQEAIRPAVGGVVGNESDLALLKLAAEGLCVEDVDSQGHGGYHHGFQSFPRSCLPGVVVAVLIDNFFVEAVTPTTHSISENGGAPSNTRGLDALN